MFQFFNRNPGGRGRRLEAWDDFAPGRDACYSGGASLSTLGQDSTLNYQPCPDLPATANSGCIDAALD